MWIYNALRYVKNKMLGGSAHEKYVAEGGLRLCKANTNGRRVAAMTFDDGPCGLECPDGRKLTEFICDTLSEHGFTATFNIIGSTKENYPDKPGRMGSFFWSGKRYDHYPMFGCDEKGGVEGNPDIVEKLLKAGNELANHGWRHIVCGSQKFPYSRRVYFVDENEVYGDYLRLHDYISNNFGYTIKGARPPHYVEKIGGGKSVFDVYKKLGYNYYSASFDAGGWEAGDTGEKMTARLRRTLEMNGDALCGAVIYQKDGLNMSGKMPILEALPAQLDLLHEYGYEIVNVRELFEQFEPSKQ